MDSLLNTQRPPVFCPGCAHEKIVQALDRALAGLGLAGHQVAIVSDIGCSGLFDTFFNTHALHGLHGRALTYATGIKLAQPHLKVIVSMGDGGLGIGGAHVLSACRRNLDLTLLVLNNFNYGMTGGQCSATTPPDAQVASGFLNRLEKPLDICEIAGAAGAPFVSRISTYASDLVQTLQAAIDFEGFALVDIWGICTGRYTRKNKVTPKTIETELSHLPSLERFKTQNARQEYGMAYREAARKLEPAPQPARIPVSNPAPERSRTEVLFLGGAGQRILTAGEILCLAAATAGLHATQKNDYPITVMRGHSISEMIVSASQIDYTGIDCPAFVVALGQEGVERRRKMLSRLDQNTFVLKAMDVNLPPCNAKIHEVDFKALRVKDADRALAALAWMAVRNQAINMEMLSSALTMRFEGRILQAALEVVDSIQNPTAADL